MLSCTYKIGYNNYCTNLAYLPNKHIPRHLSTGKHCVTKNSTLIILLCLQRAKIDQSDGETNLEDGEIFSDDEEAAYYPQLVRSRYIAVNCIL